MASQYIPLLTPAEEDALHVERLLGVEERPFQRLKGRLLSTESMLRRFPGQLPTPPPDATEDEEAAEPSNEEALAKADAERTRSRDDLLLDFEAFESFLIRIQMLKDANDRERQRYAEEKSKILETAQAVRENTADLRIQLAEAQRMMALRKEYDSLANKITGSRMLKPRDEQAVNIEKLNAEIADLEAEGRDFGNLWAERRTQFNNIVEEGKTMMRVIRGEKDEEEEEDGEEKEDGETSTQKEEDSTAGTPRPETGANTPVRVSGMDGEDFVSGNQNDLLRKAVGLSTPAVGTSSAPSPGSMEAEPAMGQDGKDTEMGEASEAIANSVSVAEAHGELEAQAGAESMDIS
ncbi:hypothetical protein MBLNU457_7469t1 [Dothideomycetes sp. NU457]